MMTDPSPFARHNPPIIDAQAAQAAKDAWARAKAETGMERLRILGDAQWFGMRARGME